MSAASLPPTLVWLRRDLRLTDHAPLALAHQSGAPVQPVFLFDTDILRHFPSKQDRRLTFIARALVSIHRQLQTKGGGLLVLKGQARQALPALAKGLGSTQLLAAEDYEPDAQQRDRHVAKAIGPGARFVKDQVLFSPTEVLKGDTGEPYKVFTPFYRAWLAKVDARATAAHTVNEAGQYAEFDAVARQARAAGLEVLDASQGAAALLRAVGYELVEDPLWDPEAGEETLDHFIRHAAAGYGDSRDMLAQPGTSRLSPFLRFGMVSIRACVKRGLAAGADKWVSELAWREFYAMVLYHFPESAHTEWNPNFRDRLVWSDSEAHFAAWKEGKTGYPVVDAAMRQLRQDGWMHNRARMIVASFLTKHLLIDWRKGEEHFAQYLMDYDMASNVGGWQWAASTGTDAQPYFRVFNPVLQSKKFDPTGDYIRRYVPELADVEASDIHAPWENPLMVDYYPPIVDHATARARALAMYGAQHFPAEKA